MMMATIERALQIAAKAHEGRGAFGERPAAGTAKAAGPSVPQAAATSGTHLLGRLRPGRAAGGGRPSPNQAA
jgi:hypothetical protein